MTSPVALFVYNRLLHTQKTIEALRRNRLAEETDVFIFSDAPKNGPATTAVREVRDYIRSVKGFGSVVVVDRPKNLGLAGSIIDGVTRIVNKFGRVIVVEDDLVTSPFFLEYMNQALDLYENDDRVISVHGYMYPINTTLPETFFMRGADCWGWATWKRGWDLFEADGRKLLTEIKRRRIDKDLNLDGTYNYTQMLSDQIAAKNDSWAVRWYSSAFLRDKLTLHPGRSLVQNIGTDQSGTHCGKTNVFDVSFSKTPVIVEKIPAVEDIVAREQIKKFLKGSRPSFTARAIGRIVRLTR